MNETENKTAEIIPMNSQTEVTKEEERTINVDEMQIAYLVGLDPEGNFAFQIFGKNKGLIQLLGLQYHAEQKIRSIYQDSQVQGDRLVHEVGKAISLLLQKVDHITQVVDPKVPDNKV